MRVHEAIAEQLARAGVSHIFTLMSEETAKLTEDLSRRGVTVMHTRHEHVAVGMADGYSRASGGPGIAIVGRGPGITNAVNALTAAAKGRSRLLVLAGRTAGHSQDGTGKRGRIRRTKFVDQPALLHALGVDHVELDRPGSAAADVIASLEHVRREGRTRVVQLPAELFDAECASPEATTPPVADPPAVDAGSVGAVADLLETDWAARRPVIVAGRGAARAGARAELERLAERIGALLSTTAQAKGMFRGSPYDIGIVGTFSAPVASELLVGSDVVLAFGASLNQYTTYEHTIFGKARVVHVDDDPAALSRYHPTELTLCADARSAAAALDQELARRGHLGAGYRSEAIAMRIATMWDRGGSDRRADSAAMHPRDLWVALDRLVPADRALVVDGGNFMEWAISHMSVPGPEAFLWPIDYGAIGCGTGNALGAAAARPDRITVLAVGDGGLMMALADLDTAVRYCLPVLVVVNNNNALGSELHYLRRQGYPGDSARYVNPSFADTARGLGLAAATVDRVADLDRVGEWLARPTGPMLLDCRIDPEAMAPAKLRGIAVP